MDDNAMTGRRRRATRKVPPAVYSAKVISLAKQGTASPNAEAVDIDPNIIARIKKCLDRAKHPQTPEAEAKAAMHIASRLMGQHNVTQAEVLAHMPESERAQCAGQSTVAIQRADGDVNKVVRHYAYQVDIGTAMTTFFKCKYYTEGKISPYSGKKTGLHFTFYGLGDNTAAAAMAFETCVNLVEKWCMRYTGGEKKSYLLGVADELIDMAEEDAAAEAKKAREAERAAQGARSKEEEAERQAQLERLAMVPPDKEGARVISAESDEEDNEDKLKTDGGPDRNSGSPGDDDGASIKSEESFSDWEGFSDHPDAGRDDTDEDMDDVESEADIGEEDEGGVQCEDDSDGEDGLQADFEEKEGGDRCYIDLTLNDIDDEIEHLINHEGRRRRQGDDSPDHAAEDQSVNSEPRPPTPNPLNGDANGAHDEQHHGETPREEARWHSEMQLVHFRNMAKAIADDYLKEQGVELTTGPKRSRTITNYAAYYEGVADGKKIDVKRKRIEG